MATQERGSFENDRNYIFWVKDGSTLETEATGATNIFSGLGAGSTPGVLAYCDDCGVAGPADCNVAFGVSCERAVSLRVLQARFSYKVEDHCDDTNCSFAAWQGTVPNYHLLHRLKCIGGYWK